MADPVSPFTPEMLQQISSLLQSQIDRSQRSTPIHQAAMAMAARMAPDYAQAAMTSSPGGGINAKGLTTPLSSGSTGPGIGTTAAAMFAAALLKHPEWLSAFKGLFPAGADPTFGGLIAGDKPFAGPNGPTGFPDASGSPFPTTGAHDNGGFNLDGRSSGPGNWTGQPGAYFGVGGSAIEPNGFGSAGTVGYI